MEYTLEKGSWENISDAVQVRRGNAAQQLLSKG